MTWYLVRSRLYNQPGLQPTWPAPCFSRYRADLLCTRARPHSLRNETRKGEQVPSRRRAIILATFVVCLLLFAAVCPDATLYHTQQGRKRRTIAAAPATRRRVGCSSQGGDVPEVQRTWLGPIRPIHSTRRAVWW